MLTPHLLLHHFVLTNVLSSVGNVSLELWIKSEVMGSIAHSVFFLGQGVTARTARQTVVTSRAVFLTIWDVTEWIHSIALSAQLKDHIFYKPALDWFSCQSVSLKDRTDKGRGDIRTIVPTRGEAKEARMYHHLRIVLPSDSSVPFFNEADVNWGQRVEYPLGIIWFQMIFYGRRSILQKIKGPFFSVEVSPFCTTGIQCALGL